MPYNPNLGPKGNVLSALLNNYFLAGTVHVCKMVLVKSPLVLSVKVRAGDFLF